MTKLYIGIDPGVTGGMAAIRADENTGSLVTDLPTHTAVNASRKETVLDAMETKAIIETMCADVRMDEVTLILEKTQPMKDSAMTAFSMGQSRGILVAVASLLGIPRIDVPPQKWKKHFGLTGCPKDASRSLACERFPFLNEELRLKKHHNRAEALLLALYGKEMRF